jgi:hypothetical protein
MVDSPRTQISPGVFAGKQRPVLGSRNLSSSPGSRNPTEPGLDGPLPLPASQCEIVTQLYSVNPYACTGHNRSEIDRLSAILTTTSSPFCTRESLERFPTPQSCPPHEIPARVIIRI